MTDRNNEEFIEQKVTSVFSQGKGIVLAVRVEDGRVLCDCYHTGDFPPMDIPNAERLISAEMEKVKRHNMDPAAAEGRPGYDSTSGQ